MHINTYIHTNTCAWKHIHTYICISTRSHTPDTIMLNHSYTFPCTDIPRTTVHHNPSTQFSYRPACSEILPHFDPKNPPTLTQSTVNIIAYQYGHVPMKLSNTSMVHRFHTYHLCKLLSLVIQDFIHFLFDRCCGVKWKRDLWRQLFKIFSIITDSQHSLYFQITREQNILS